MIIEVKEKHIREAKKKFLKMGQTSGHCCPISLAIQETIKTTDVNVCSDEIYIDWKIYIPSRSCSRFVEAFDNWAYGKVGRDASRIDFAGSRPKTVKPFKFRLNYTP